MIGDDGAGAAVAVTHKGGGDDVNCKWNHGKNVVMELETPWHDKCMFVAELRHDSSWKNVISQK